MPSAPEELRKPSIYHSSATAGQSTPPAEKPPQPEREPQENAVPVRERLNTATHRMIVAARAMNWAFVAVAAVSVVALLVSLLDFGLITGGVTLPVPGLQEPGATSLRDGATYNFERDIRGWRARGAASSVVWNNAHTFAGQGALEAQITGLTVDQTAFVYTTLPATAHAGSTVTAHAYIPAGATQMVATIYCLDGSWQWSSGTFPELRPGQWTAITYRIPTGISPPVRELGVMFVGAKNAPPYSGPVFLDGVNVQP